MRLDIILSFKWRVDHAGYLTTTVYDPETKQKYPIRQHRLIWEIYRGPIPQGFHVHHKNGTPTDNRIENLELLSAGAHTSHHQEQKRQMGVVKNCPYCHQEFVAFGDKKYCQKRCRTGAAVDRWRERNPEGNAIHCRAYQLRRRSA